MIVLVPTNTVLLKSRSKAKKKPGFMDVKLTADFHIVLMSMFRMLLAFLKCL